MYVHLCVCTVRACIHIHIHIRTYVRTYIQHTCVRMCVMYLYYCYDVCMQYITFMVFACYFLEFCFRCDCRHFSVDVPEFSVAEELQADITRFEKMWSLYDQFQTGLLEMTKEDWISFRYVHTCIRTYIYKYVHTYIQYTTEHEIRTEKCSDTMSAQHKICSDIYHKMI